MPDETAEASAGQPAAVAALVPDVPVAPAAAAAPAAPVASAAEPALAEPPPTVPVAPPPGASARPLLGGAAPAASGSPPNARMIFDTKRLGGSSVTARSLSSGAPQGPIRPEPDPAAERPRAARFGPIASIALHRGRDARDAIAALHSGQACRKFRAPCLPGQVLSTNKNHTPHTRPIESGALRSSFSHPWEERRQELIRRRGGGKTERSKRHG